MAPHSSTLAWKIPRTEEPGGLQSMGSRRVGHKVWTKEGDVFKAHAVETGTTNGMITEIVKGLAEGAEVLVDFKIATQQADQQQGEQANNPFMPKPRGNNNKNANQQKKQ